MENVLDCPVDRVLINENKARMVAALVVILTLVFIITPNWIIPLFLAVDFFVRATIYGKFSLLGWMAEKLVFIFKIKNKPTDRAPKRFAAGVGFAFSVLIILSRVLNLEILFYGLSIILVLFAILESGFGLCAGCYVYSYLKKWGLLNWS